VFFWLAVLSFLLGTSPPFRGVEGILRRFSHLIHIYTPISLFSNSFVSIEAGSFQRGFVEGGSMKGRILNRGRKIPLWMEDDGVMRGREGHIFLLTGHAHFDELLSGKKRRAYGDNLKMMTESMTEQVKGDKLLLRNSGLGFVYTEP